MGPHEINGLTKREQMSTACIVFLVPISLLFRPINSYVYYTLYSMIANKYSRKKWKLRKYGAPWKKWSCQEGGNDDHQYHFNAVFWMVASEFDDFGFLILAFFLQISVLGNPGKRRGGDACFSPRQKYRRSVQESLLVVGGKQLLCKSDWHARISRFPCCISFIFVALIFVLKYWQI